MDWTEERVALLARLWQEGFSARQIAERLGEEVTRNAVIGKANRLGLSKPSKSSVTRRQRKKEREEKVLQLQPPMDEGTSIFSLTASTCRWPIGDPGDEDFHFCGSKSTVGQPYCDYHAAMAYQPAQTKSGRKKIA
ncbi:MAG: GcrA family cell cycle regulator [Alphaproteobacteria bacterium]|nr:GcrA family cell cycle regulator [Alphaproteobacteria bacterium]MDP6567782.1 GcrA family cell cycle regulator [Alphaproteobacteria bacterium]MDP6813109.1 GcrA family cell cycle regulator [Alphaproteobacteria bacterium]